jgi:hypothetical protein
MVRWIELISTAVSRRSLENSWRLPKTPRNADARWLRLWVSTSVAALGKSFSPSALEKAGENTTVSRRERRNSIALRIATAAA